MNIVVAIVLTFGEFFCRNSPPQPPVPTIFLSVEDVGVTDAFVRVTLANDNKPSSFTLTRDGKTFFTAARRDTLILTDSLLPKHSYVLKAYRFNGNTIFDSSDALNVTTMDTTSHNFTWQIDTLGNGSSSALYDVAIINDTLVYAVGEIYLKDSTGQIDPHAYSLAIWNGTRWQVKRLYYDSSSVIARIRGILAFGANDVWLAAGSVFHWDGVSSQAPLVFSRLALPDPFATIYKMWGRSSSDIYGVGNVGTIVHFDGTSWQKLESGTTVTIDDIWGVDDALSGKPLILATASNIASLGDMKILQIHDQNIVDTIPWVANRAPYSIWFEDAHRLFVCGEGVFERKPNKLWYEVGGISTIPYFTEHIRGMESNDIFAVGDFGIVAHFNGDNWKVYSELAAAAVYPSVAYNRKTIVAVGYTSTKAIALTMRR